MLFRSVVNAIREHCPKLRAILLSSASTAPTVEHAARKLGVDGYVSSDVDVYAEGDTQVYSAPTGLPRALGRRRPRFFSRPGAVVHNAAVNKVNLLLANYPEVYAPGAISVENVVPVPVTVPPDIPTVPAMEMPSSSGRI